MKKTLHIADTLTTSRRSGPVALLAAGLLMLSACATPPADAPPPRPPLPSPYVKFSPTQNQAPAQQERDRYECFHWAVTQTGFDPSRARYAPVTAHETQQLANRIEHFRRAMTACLSGRNYRVD